MSTNELRMIFLVGLLALAVLAIAMEAVIYWTARRWQARQRVAEGAPRQGVARPRESAESPRAVDFPRRCRVAVYRAALAAADSRVRPGARRGCGSG